YYSGLIKPYGQQNQPADHERQLLKDFMSDDEKYEEIRDLPSGYYYYAAIRATKSCLRCHPRPDQKEELGDLRENALMGIVRVHIPTEGIKESVHFNRAVLLAIALCTALLIMTGSWLIVRYVIVKPVKHLKEVSDAISAGELNVRSEIQTGDEF